jgi:hypothetical protein
MKNIILKDDGLYRIIFTSELGERYLLSRVDDDKKLYFVKNFQTPTNTSYSISICKFTTFMDAYNFWYENIQNIKIYNPIKGKITFKRIKVLKCVDVL